MLGSKGPTPSELTDASVPVTFRNRSRQSWANHGPKNGPPIPTTQEPAAPASANGLISETLAGLISEVAQAAIPDKADIAAADELVLRMIDSGECTFDRAARAIGAALGRGVAHRLLLDARDAYSGTGPHVSRAHVVLEEFKVIGRTGYLPTALDAMTYAALDELFRARPVFHAGGHA